MENNRSRKVCPPRTNTDLTKRCREKLQNGDLSILFENKQILELFEKDLKEEGINAKIAPVPEGEVFFVVKSKGTILKFKPS